MKKIFLCVSLFFVLNSAFSQHFMHGAGITFKVSSAGGGHISYGAGFTYSARINFVETEKLSVSAGIPLSVAISASTHSSYNATNDYYYDNAEVGFVINAPVIVNLNMGRGSTKANRQKFGYFFGAGLGYHHGDFLVDETDASGDNFVGTRSLNTFGPAANAGVRLGVGRKHRNIELRLSYMKGLNETKPNVFGIAGLFNF